MTQRPELIDYARLVEVNNDIVQLDEKISSLQTQMDSLVGRRSNLVKLEAGIRSRLAPPPPDVTPAERHILSQMVNFNCWLTTQDGQCAELHPYNSPDVLENVDNDAANRLATCGFIQLHRNLDDGRTAWRIADRGRKVIEG